MADKAKYGAAQPLMDYAAGLEDKAKSLLGMGSKKPAAPAPEPSSVMNWTPKPNPQQAAEIERNQQRPLITKTSQRAEKRRSDAAKEYHK